MEEEVYYLNMSQEAEFIESGGGGGPIYAANISGEMAVLERIISDMVHTWRYKVRDENFIFL